MDGSRKQRSGGIAVDMRHTRTYGTCKVIHSPPQTA